MRLQFSLRTRLLALSGALVGVLGGGGLFLLLAPADPRVQGALSGLGLLLALALATLVLRSILRPLRDVLETARQINAAVLPAEPPTRPPAPDEFGEVALALRQFRRQADSLHKMVQTDGLTGLASRARLDQLLRLALDDARQRGEAAALLFMDVDHFRAVNDSLGHQAGDEYLIEIAQRLQRMVPVDALLCRYSGDKFVALMRRLRLDDSLVPLLRTLADRILRGLATPYAARGQALHMSASIGIAVYPRDGGGAEALVASADAAMYLAKRQGRNNAQFAHPELTASARRHLALASELRHGLEVDEFEPRYQPIVNVASGQVASCEALLRWRHPRRGLVLPGEFIGMAEDSGLINPLGERCLERVCAQAKLWHGRRQRLPLSVNLSARQLRDRQIVRTIEDLDLALGLPPEDLAFELTESAMMEHPERSLEILLELKSLGHRLSIDDFGTGYSSLAYLQRFPIDCIKLDRSFIAKVESSRPALAIISATLTLARNLGLEVVAEGVETVSQMRRLHELGCDLQQGFFFAPALPPDELEHWAAQPRLPLGARAAKEAG